MKPFIIYLPTCLVMICLLATLSGFQGTGDTFIHGLLVFSGFAALLGTIVFLMYSCITQTNKGL